MMNFLRNAGQFLVDISGWIFGAIFFVSFFLLIVGLTEKNIQRQNDCLAQHKVVVRYNDSHYCADLNALAPVK